MTWTAAQIREWERTGVRPPAAVWLPAQTAWFLNSIRGDPLYAAYHLIALRGLRRGNLENHADQVQSAERLGMCLSGPYSNPVRREAK